MQDALSCLLQSLCACTRQQRTLSCPPAPDLVHPCQSLSWRREQA
ncbi:Protein of unknown function [Gryllus bimaculatus]|nr:Protein of unknown function [Gryllus bimaculatus]